MGEPDSLNAIFDFGPAMLEKVLGVLQKVGIDPPLLVVQVFLFIIIGFLFAWLFTKVRQAKKKPFVLVMGLAALGLIMAGIAFSWLEQVISPLPGQLTGIIEVTDGSVRTRLGDMRLTLLDYQGRKISTEEGVVDGVEGRFFLSYPKTGGLQPRLLRFSLPGCKTQDYSLGRHELRRGVVSVQFTCGGES